MTGTSFHLDIGEFQCIVVSDGMISVPGPVPGCEIIPVKRWRLEQ